jgi:AcrR family transcriptional regulator
MQDVVDSLDVAKGTVYYYFKSKEELLEAVIHDIIDETTAQMQIIVDQADGSAVDKIRLLFLAGRQVNSHEDILEHLHQPGNRNMHARLLAVAVQKQAPLYAALIQKGREEGLFQTNTPLESAEFILAALQFLTDEGIYPWPPETLARRILAFPSIIENQLKAQPGTFEFLLEITQPGQEENPI